MVKIDLGKIYSKKFKYTRLFMGVAIFMIIIAGYKILYTFFIVGTEDVTILNHATDFLLFFLATYLLIQNYKKSKISEKGYLEWKNEKLIYKDIEGKIIEILYDNIKDIKVNINKAIITTKEGTEHTIGFKIFDDYTSINTIKHNLKTINS